MIALLQRFQTLLVFIAFVLSFLMFFLKMSVFSNGEVMNFTDYTPFTIMIIVTTVLDAFILSFFRNRIVQIRLCIMNTIILCGFQIWIVVSWFNYHNDMRFGLACIFPFICLVLMVLAIRYIGRDEALVQSANRLRGSRRR